jgi:predicted Na+-dependent transporter
VGAPIALGCTRPSYRQSDQDYNATAGHAALGTTPGRCHHGHTGMCPVAVTTQDPELTQRLDPETGARWMTNYLKALTMELTALTGLAGFLDRFLLPLVLMAAALGISVPGPGRRADAAGAILITLAVLVFSTGAAMTFSEIGAIRAASRRLAVVLPVSTVALPVLAWLASHLVSGVALRGGILSAGIAPAEVASVALTGLAGGEAALAGGLLAASTILTVLLAGPVLSIAGAHSSASPLGLLFTLALVVALPLIAGSTLRSLDPFHGRDQPVTRVLGTASLLVLLWEVASQIHLSAGDARIVLALLAYLAGGVILGWLLAIGASPAQRTAIVLPTAMRDFAIAAGIAASAFGAAASAPLGIYGLLVLIFGTAAVYAARQRKPAPTSP